jgi:hypothetical protein
MTCLSCKNEVTVKPIRYGDGFIATCPKCWKLAMNERRRDERDNSSGVGSSIRQGVSLHISHETGA